MSAESFVLFIPTERQNKTDSALKAWLDINPHATVDDALSAIFQIGVSVQLALAEVNKEASHA